MAFLGHLISAKSILHDPEKSKAITAVPPARKYSELRSFIGMVAYNRQFISNCGELIAPLTVSTGKKAKFVWVPLRDI